MKPKLILITASLVIVFGTGALGWYTIPKIHLPKSETKSNLKITPEYFQVTKVVDGDTIEVNINGKIEKVRLIGIDTPETKKPKSPIECFGKEASDYAHNLMDGRKVSLEKDAISSNRDRYNRLLRYVYLKDGRLVNSEMIKQGYGFAFLSFPFTKKDEFRKNQKEARNANRGLWENEACVIQDINGRYKTNTI